MMLGPIAQGLSSRLCQCTFHPRCRPGVNADRVPTTSLNSGGGRASSGVFLKTERELERTRHSLRRGRVGSMNAMDFERPLELLSREHIRTN